MNMIRIKGFIIVLCVVAFFSLYYFFRKRYAECSIYDLTDDQYDWLYAIMDDDDIIEIDDEDNIDIE